MRSAVTAWVWFVEFAYFLDCVGVLRFSQLRGYPVKNSDAVQYSVCVQSGSTLPVHCAADRQLIV